MRFPLNRNAPPLTRNGEGEEIVRTLLKGKDMYGVVYHINIMIIIDRIQTVIAERISDASDGSGAKAGDLLYALTQVSEGSVEVAAESRDATDKDGNLIKM